MKLTNEEQGSRHTSNIYIFLILFLDDFFICSAVFQLDIITEVMENFAESYVVLIFFS